MEDKDRRVKKARHSSRKRLLERIRPNAAGIDCGAAELYVAVPPDRDPEPVRRFKTFTADLHRMADWLVACRIDTVAMESTGVYWIPAYEILEDRGLEVLLVNAQHVKNVSGRKSDVSDCEWLQELHSVGLLRGSFRPTAKITALRTLLRHRDVLIQSTVTATNRMEKALVQMNLRLHLVVSDLIGLTGQRIIRDIVAGRTDPQQLAKHRDPHCRASEAEIAAALTGHYRAELLFVLKQNLETFDAIHGQIEELDGQIQACLADLARDCPEVGDDSKPRRKHKPRRNEPRFDVEPLLQRLTGRAVTHIHGIGPYTTLRVISEVGVDMSRWRTENHFTSWLTLAPNNKISGGRLLSSRTLPSANRAAGIFRMAAMTLTRSQTALGAFYRRLAYRIGKPKAITATARKLAILFYRSLKGDFVYKDPGADAYDRRHREATVRHLRRRAEVLGFSLVNLQTGEILGGVS